ncbi:MAG: UbiA prenyltransferase family protein [Bacteroidia bacterium]|nr:UbiA prenyltransferase family protein [Bacteroidia bacterium]
MITKSSILHLRIPFSIFLMPVFSFALSQAKEVNWLEAGLVFVILHLFLYPASNGFNSYFDRDEDSIGGLEKPPRVENDLLWLSLGLDAVALGLAGWLSWKFALMLLIYGLISKAYSWDKIRLKALPVTGWLAVGLFQGAFTYLACLLVFNHWDFVDLLQAEAWLPALLTSLLLMGSYPMTQVYQHAEDGRRGDRTLSRMLGIRGTFHFTALFFLGANAGFFYYFLHFHTLWHFLAFQAFLFPTLVYFGLWYLRVRKDENAADFKSTMRLNVISSICMILYFTLLTFWPWATAAG